jgi:hypothetical protein
MQISKQGHLLSFVKLEYIIKRNKKDGLITQLKMGWANCRFKDETGCKETGSSHYHVTLEDIGVMLDVPCMWKHYMTEHLVQPTERERQAVMAANSDKASSKKIQTRGRPEIIQVMYVEKTDRGYTHNIGTRPDTEFIEKLETLIGNKGEPLMTFGKPGYR